YLYFSYHGRGGNGRRAKHKRCGVAGTEESERICAEHMRSYLEGRSVDILGELQDVQARLGELDAQARRRNKKRKPASVARAKNFDARQLAKSIRIAEPVIHYKSSTRMDEVKSGSVHLIVTSPPYNVGKKYSSHNDSMDFGPYLWFLNDVWTECARVLCDGGRIAVNVADTWRTPYVPLHSHITQQLLELGMLMRGVIYWDKGTSAGASTAWGSWRSASNPTLRDVGEFILVFS
ncbi:MAG: site-specific DNA-methyltransferase, partial [Nitrosopumilaceae archaeon]|nr:site-specific DNA-methyltransferase [Nitrosopumilaceae archaeon]